MGGTSGPVTLLVSQPGHELRDRVSEWSWGGPCPKAIASSIDHMTLTPERMTDDGSHHRGSAGGCNLSSAAGGPWWPQEQGLGDCIETLALC